MLDQARVLGWKVRGDALLSGYPFPEAPARAGAAAEQISEIVFFGRLEVRKGLLLFLEACQGLPPRWLSRSWRRDTLLSDGGRALDADPSPAAGAAGSAAHGL